MKGTATTYRAFMLLTAAIVAPAVLGQPARPAITAGWTSAAPTIDGVIDDQWSTASTLDISVDEIASQPVTLYLMNDADTLYLGIVDENDNTINADDQIGVYIDDEGGTPPVLYDQAFANPFCLPPNHGEGNYFFGAFDPDPNDEWREWIDDPETCATEIGTTNTQFALSAVGGAEHYEVAIPLDGSSALVAAPGETFGSRVYVAFDNGVDAFEVTGRWPAESVFNDPTTYGDITLALPTPIPTLSLRGLLACILSLLATGAWFACRGSGRRV